MIRDVKHIRTIDVLYRVSTVGQELEGESLFVQRESVEEKWAKPNGISIRRRIICTESGKSALRLKGAGFEFNRRAEYTELIVEYQRMQRSQLPDAVVVDWYERWSRFPLEMLGLIEAFSALGIRMLAIGDQLELTDPRQRLVTTIKSAVAGEQLRITAEKVREVKASRRSRACWQGGVPPDGYRSHTRDCPGLTTVHRETPDGEKKAYRVRACSCSNVVLQRDPAREATLLAIWDRLQNSPLTFDGIADEVNAAGHRTRNGLPWNKNLIYRLGQNPHYAGILAYDRFVRDPHDGKTLSQRPLTDQVLVTAPQSIHDPYVDAATFWQIQERRYGRSGRIVAGLQRGSRNELYGLVFCAYCQRRMATTTKLSPTKTGHGNPRISPRRTWRYCLCTDATCPGSRSRNYLNADVFGNALVAKLEQLVSLDDAALIKALQLRRPSKSPASLQREKSRLERERRDIGSARHVLIADRAADRISQKDYEAELFAFRRDGAAVDERLRAIDAELSQNYARPTFEAARVATLELAKRWDALNVAERSEVLRLLLRRVTFTIGTKGPVVLEWGAAFAQRAAPSAVAYEIGMP